MERGLVSKVIATWVALTMAAAALFSGCSAASVPTRKQGSAEIRLFLELPEKYKTPDGAALDGEGNIILSIPNFNNDALLEAGTIQKPSPPEMAIIDRDNNISTWYRFKPEDMHPDTGRIGPMDAAFGPDGNLYLADMQVFWDGDHKSRLLRINVVDGTPVGMDVVAEGFIVCSLKLRTVAGTRRGSSGSRSFGSTRIQFGPSRGNTASGGDRGDCTWPSSAS